MSSSGAKNFIFTLDPSGACCTAAKALELTTCSNEYVSSWTVALIREDTALLGTVTGRSIQYSVHLKTWKETGFCCCARSQCWAECKVSRLQPLDCGWDNGYSRHQSGMAFGETW